MNERRWGRARGREGLVVARLLQKRSIGVVSVPSKGARPLTGAQRQARHCATGFRCNSTFGTSSLPPNWRPVECGLGQREEREARQQYVNGGHKGKAKGDALGYVIARYVANSTGFAQDRSGETAGPANECFLRLFDNARQCLVPSLA